MADSLQMVIHFKQFFAIKYSKDSSKLLTTSVDDVDDEVELMSFEEFDEFSSL
jgi:hypothetical protein